MRTSQITFLFFLILFECAIVDSINPIGLKASSTLRGFTLGTAVAVRYLRANADDGRYSDYLRQNYQLVIPGSELMAKHIWLGENHYDFNDSDWMLGATSNTTGWVQQMGLEIRGHNLVWAYDRNIPDWILKQESSMTPDKAKSLLSDYIHTVVGRYKGKIQWWDVINEAISDYNVGTPYNIRDSFWLRKLGPDYIIYAFQFAHEADPEMKLFYNEYVIETTGVKTDRVLEFIKWIQSQGIPIFGLGMQWHINSSTVITPGDSHYQSVQQFLDLNISVTISELDISIFMRDGYPINMSAVQDQARVYRALLDYALYFYPKMPAIMSWGYTDRYSWLPLYTNYTKSEGLPLDCQYQPKPAYWQLQEGLARVLTDGIYRLSPQLQSDQCLGTTTNSTNSTVQLFQEPCNKSNQRWNITWQFDGTYRLTPQSAMNSALNTENATASIGQIQTTHWTGDANQEWVSTSHRNGTYRVGPRNAWWRVLAPIGGFNVAIVDYNVTDTQYWVPTLI